jgi:hypothetical protein
MIKSIGLLANSLLMSLRTERSSDCETLKWNLIFLPTSCRARLDAPGRVHDIDPDELLQIHQQCEQNGGATF